jgi:hypothetical protein
MNGDVEKYVMECESCSKLKVGKNPTAPLGISLNSAQNIRYFMGKPLYSYGNI